MTLLREIETFLKARGMTPSRFGREAVNDPRFVFCLRDGREPRRKTEEKARRFMLTHVG